MNAFIALALGLREWGHQVQVAASRHFAASMKSIPLSIIPDRRFDRQRELMEVCRDSDVLVFHPAYLHESAVVSEYLRKPLLYLYPYPYKPDFGPRRLLFNTNERRKKADVNEWRKRLGLGPLRRDLYKSLEQQQVPVLHAYSPALTPFPNLVGNHHYYSGAIKSSKPRSHQENGRVPDELKRWLDDGDTAPIFFGFDRMPLLEPSAMSAMIAAATKPFHARAIISVGRMSAWAEMPFLSAETVFTVPSVDHGWLFPRCSCIIHHGGAELTHLAAASGIPSIICSTYDDEAYWGERTAFMNIGRHLPFSKMSPERLQQMVLEVRQPSVRVRSEELGRRMQAENGLHHALEWLEQQLIAAPIYRNE